MLVAGLVALFLRATAVATNPESEAACQIGALILSGPPDTGTPLGREAVYDDHWKLSFESVPPSNIFDACPSLRSNLPSNRRLATDADRKRASGITQPDPLTIFGISAPVLNSKRTKATVLTGYSCPGLCVGIFVSRYKLVHRRWVQVEAPQLRVVS